MASTEFSDLTAVFINCTLKPSPEPSNTAALMADSVAIMRANGVTVDELRAVDHAIAPGVQPDMREAGFPDDGWPALRDRVLGADILVLGSPIWLGEKSSVCTRVVERLYAHSAETNDAGQYVFYNKVAGSVITGNEDGYKHVGMNLTYSLQHLGYTVPPQSSAGWVGEAGPGPSYADEGSDGPASDFTQQTLTFMTWNLMHMAAMLKRSGGIPAHGTSTTAWQDGERFDHPRG
ncbi:flavodoxin family protein [Actinotalea sp. C106]|uniref:flavodoxin family protein n=1 Tax=Actinotalea sp. C106 TaxID=2908644 RepID=UPI0020289593|nr:NAD(P)H-dependent oxidoreductase [Actinotalea sp. C106]